MMETLYLLWGTVLLRPYVFVFMAFFLFISYCMFGGKRTLLFALAGYFIAFTSEFLSTRYGFPYGLYHYIQAPTADKELWISNVPFMDSLSYSFLAFFSYTFAIFLSSPLYKKGWRMEMVDTKKIRHSPYVLLLGSFLMVWIDILVDPASNQGEKWFLGKIYYYDPPGFYHGVPLSNFLGWYLVAFLIISSYQRLDILMEKKEPFQGGLPVPYKGFYGICLYFGIMGFILFVTFLLCRDYPLGLTGVFIALPLFMWFLSCIFKGSNRATEEEIKAHLEDFPHSPVAQLWEKEE